MMIQLGAAFLGSIGFAIFLKMKGKQILHAGLGGLITWFIYLMVFDFCQSEFISNLIAAIFVGIFAEIMARVNRAPSTIFLTAAAIPLIPGGKLYYTMYGLVSEEHALFIESGTSAVVIALAISLGFVVVAVLKRYLDKAFRKIEA
jgi:uncharacterized membrane protein YjjB (DUF3815 family)